MEWCTITPDGRFLYTAPQKSLVIATQKDGGLAVFDLKGKVKQIILPAKFGDIRYNNVDLVDNFSLGDNLVDFAVASDRQNDTQAIYKIDPLHKLLHCGVYRFIFITYLFS